MVMPHRRRFDSALCRKAASFRLPSYLHARRSRNFRSAVLGGALWRTTVRCPVDVRPQYFDETCRIRKYSEESAYTFAERLPPAVRWWRRAARRCSRGEPVLKVAALRLVDRGFRDELGSPPALAAVASP
jgi:hypothetical protein